MLKVRCIPRILGEVGSKMKVGRKMKVGHLSQIGQFTERHFTFAKRYNAYLFNCSKTIRKPSWYIKMLPTFTTNLFSQIKVFEIRTGASQGTKKSHAHLELFWAWEWARDFLVRKKKHAISWKILNKWTKRYLKKNKKKCRSRRVMTNSTFTFNLIFYLQFHDENAFSREMFHITSNDDDGDFSWFRSQTNTFIMCKWKRK